MRFQREATWVYLWLIHTDVGQRLMQYCKAVILQLKINKLKKKNEAGAITIDSDFKWTMK